MSELLCEPVSSPVSYMWNVLAWNISRRYEYRPCSPHGSTKYTRAQTVVFTMPCLSYKDAGMSTVQGVYKLSEHFAEPYIHKY